MFPTDSCFKNRITDATFSPSKSSNNPMVTLKTEIVAPTDYEIGEEKVNLLSIPCEYYLVTTVLDEKGNVDEAKTAVKRTAFKKFFSDIELNPDTVNWDNIDVSQLKGIILLTAMRGEEKEKRKTPTAAQIAAAKAKNQRPEGDIMRNPKTNKPMTIWRPVITDIFGRAPAVLTL